MDLSSMLSSKTQDTVKKALNRYGDLKTSYTNKKASSFTPFYSSKYEGMKEEEPYSFWKPDKSGRWESPDETTELKSLSGGQFITDPERPGVLIKSERRYTPKQNASILNGMPSWGKEIDHIIPLWAGGADTKENKETLSIADHQKKTNIGGVAQRLYYDGKISLNDARVMQLGWRDLDDKGIELGENGVADLDTAILKQQEWQKPKKIDFKDWWNAFKEGPRGTLGEFAQGAASGATLGWVPAEGHKYQTEEETTNAAWARGAGQVVGSIGSFIAGYGILGSAAKAVAGTKIVGATKPLTWLAELQKAKPAEILFKNGLLQVKKNTAARFLQNAGVFTALGQLSKQEESGMGTRVKRFLEDAAWAGVFSVPSALKGATATRAPKAKTGFLSKLMKKPGAVTAETAEDVGEQAVKSYKAWEREVKGYAGIATGSYFLTILEGGSPKDGMINAALMTGLHGVGRINAPTIEEAANTASKNWRAKYLETKPRTGTYTKAEIEAENAKIMEKIHTTVAVEDQIKEIEKMLISGKQLYKGGLASEQKVREEVADMFSLWSRNSKIAPEDFNRTPSRVDSLKVKIESFTNNPRAKETYNNEPTGKMVLTGLSSEIRPDVAKDIKRYYNDGGRNGDLVFGYIREDKNYVNFLKRKGGYNNPQNNIEWYAFKNGDIYKIGNTPRPGKIPGINARIEQFNDVARRRNYPLLSQMGENMNKNDVAEAMRRRGDSFVTGKISHINTEGRGWENVVGSGEPSLVVEITPENWNIASGLKEYLNTAKNKVVNKVAVNKKTASQPELLPSKKEVYSFDKFKRGEISGYFNSGIRNMQNVFSAKSVEQLQKMLKNNMGITVSREAATRLFNKRNSYTVKEGLEIWKAYHDIGRLSKEGENIYKALAGDFVNNMKKNIVNKMSKMYLVGEKVEPVKNVFKKKEDTVSRKMKKFAKNKINTKNIVTNEQSGIKRTSKSTSEVKPIAKKVEAEIPQKQYSSFLKTDEKAKTFDNHYQRIKQILEDKASQLGEKKLASDKNKALLNVLDIEVNKIPRAKYGIKKTYSNLNSTEVSELKQRLKNFLSEKKEYLTRLETKPEEYSGSLEGITAKEVGKLTPEELKDVNIKKEGEKIIVTLKGKTKSGENKPPQEILSLNKNVENKLSTDLKNLSKPKLGLIKNKESVSAFRLGEKTTRKTSTKLPVTVEKDMWGKLWGELENTLNDKFKWLDRATGIKESWRHVNLNRGENTGLSFTNYPFKKVATSQIEVKPEFATYASAINIERLNKLPKEIKNIVQDVKQKHPNSKIRVFAGARRAGTSSGPVYNMYNELRKATTEVKTTEDLKRILDTDYKNLTKKELKDINRWQETGKKEDLPEWIAEEIEKDYLRSRQYKKSEEITTAKGKTQKTSGWQLLNDVNGRISNERDVGEISFNPVTWNTNPVIEFGKLTDKELKMVAENMSYMFEQEIRSNLPQGGVKKVFTGNKPQITGFLGLMSILLALSGNPQEQ